MLAAKLRGSWPGHPTAWQVTGLFSWIVAADSGTSSRSPLRGRPQAEAPGPGRRKGGGAGSPSVRPKSQPPGVQVGPLLSGIPGESPIYGRAAWRLVSRNDCARGPRSAGRGGGQCVTARQGPPPPTRPNSTPREGGADKGSGPPARPQTGPGTAHKASRVGSLGTVGHRTGHARFCEPRLRRRLLREGDARGSATRAAEAQSAHGQGALSSRTLPASRLIPAAPNPWSLLKKPLSPTPNPERAPRSRRN